MVTQGAPLRGPTRKATRSPMGSSFNRKASGLRVSCNYGLPQCNAQPDGRLV